MFAGLRAAFLAVFLVLLGAVGAVAQGDPRIATLQQAIATGQFDVAAEVGRGYFRAAEQPVAKAAIARLVASAHFRAGRLGLARYWLRLAAQHARGTALEQGVAQDFAALRQASPFSYNLSFSAAPSSNVNNGSSSETIEIWGLPFVLSPDARPLSGWQFFGGANLSYKLEESQSRQTSIGASLSLLRNQLSSEAKEKAPMVSGSDYDFDALELFAEHRWITPGASGPSGLRFSVGRNWYGGAPYQSFWRTQYTQDVRLQNGVQLGFGIAHQVYFDERSNFHGQVTTLPLSIGWQVGNGDQIRVDLGLEHTATDDIFAQHNARRVRLGYTFARPVLGAGLSLFTGLEARDYALSLYSADGRHDLTNDISAKMTLVGLEQFGFVPTVTLTAQRTRSNVTLFNRESVGLQFGVESRF